MTYAADKEFFKNECKLPIGTSVVLTKLSREIAEGETAGIRISYYFSCHAHHVDSKLTALQQAGDAETSDTASKRPRLEIEDDDQGRYVSSFDPKRKSFLLLTKRMLSRMRGETMERLKGRRQKWVEGAALNSQRGVKAI